MSLLKYESTVTEISQILTQSNQFGRQVQLFLSGAEAAEKFDDLYFCICFIQKLDSNVSISWKLSFNIRILLILLKQDNNQVILGNGFEPVLIIVKLLLSIHEKEFMQGLTRENGFLRMSDEGSPSIRINSINNLYFVLLQLERTNCTSELLEYFSQNYNCSCIGFA